MHNNVVLTCTYNSGRGGQQRPVQLATQAAGVPLPATRKTQKLGRDAVLMPTVRLHQGLPEAKDQATQVHSRYRDDQDAQIPEQESQTAAKKHA